MRIIAISVGVPRPALSNSLPVRSQYWADDRSEPGKFKYELFALVQWAVTYKMPLYLDANNINWQKDGICPHWVEIKPSEIEFFFRNQSVAGLGDAPSQVGQLFIEAYRYLRSLDSVQFHFPS